LKGVGHGMVVSKMPDVNDNFITELVYGKNISTEDNNTYADFLIKKYLDSLKDDSKKNNWDGKE